MDCPIFAQKEAFIAPSKIIKKVLRRGYARAGIRTRVDGMKTRNDGPDYTTRAVFAPLASRS